MTEIVAHIDGAARGNPGPAAYGVVIESAQGAPVAALAKFLGETTNNVAEYQGLLAALDYALNHHFRRLNVVTDSELMARQISGRYKVRSPGLRPLHEKAQAMIARLESFSIRHVLREHNREADRLANQALDDAEAGIAPPATAPRAASPRASNPAPAAPLRTAAIFQRGVLKPLAPLPLHDGEEVELEIRRKK
ncbi:MAG: reverse transcriptase-like protein [Terriglobia bacterium]|jgi:probable phosphoglycerate mutase